MQYIAWDEHLHWSKINITGRGGGGGVVGGGGTVVERWSVQPAIIYLDISGSKYGS